MSEDDEVADSGAGASDFGRIFALSDGVFAIALTLLVLQFTIPPGLSGPEFRQRLADLMPNGLAYALSFATIARFWVVHRQAFRGLTRLDGYVVSLNFVFLGLIAFVPFPTLVLGNYGKTLGATLFYAACITATNVGSTVLFWYVSGRPGMLRADPQEIRVGRARRVTATIVFALSIPVAFLSIRAAQAMWILVFLLPPAVGRLAARGRHEGTSRRLTP